MSMAIDNLALKKITLDLEEELVGAFFDKPFALSTNQFALEKTRRIKEEVVSSSL